MSGRVSAGENGLQSEHDNTGFNKASGRNKKRGFPRLLSGPPRKEESYSVRIVSAHELLCV